MRESGRGQGRGQVRGRTAWLACALLPALCAAACEKPAAAQARETAVALVGGNPERGRRLIGELGCKTCHTIPGIPGANSLVGPPLTGIASRVYIAGVLTNQPANMVRWLVNPPGVDSLTAMPNMGLSAAQATDIATYLYTLR
ncbi:MAG TPA: c-type cytochrome [Longimicrobiales bacterium]|nr:c-type cytochrome [Longimicrobiales bacterium]